ncbi:hypothetical protein QLH52_12015 [Methylomonas sp. OY6]|uniref:Uncharacterized protein n=1 Tax=Methylomonas defluvii TaxID=3045149 RepID=A0ABU4UEW4_9GAMM|nr:hypothetical protein [Methylomonas sp. OY6]MDX8128011.1 hypothetical protein [Methylomonas sp. OY6]
MATKNLLEKLRVGEKYGLVKTIGLDYQFKGVKKNFEAHGISGLENILRSDEILSKDTRDFIADVIVGKIKRPKGRYSDKERDFNIALSIDDHLTAGDNLTSHKDKPGAAQIVADRYGIEEDAAIKIFQRMKDKVDEFKADMDATENF